MAPTSTPDARHPSLTTATTTISITTATAITTTAAAAAAATGQHAPSLIGAAT